LLATFALVVSYVVSRETAARQRTEARAAAGKHASAGQTVSVLGGKFVFRDAETQAREYIGYYHTINLTAEQEAIKAEVLKAMPAACCRNSTAYTCCCPCNLSKSLWGLSNYVIATHRATADELRTVADAWLGFVNPDGFQGSACYQGRCEEKPSKDGCGGMNENDLTL
jgi:hypothetical protein